MVQASGTQGGFAPVASSSVLSQQLLTLPAPQRLPLSGSVSPPLNEVLHSSQSSDLTTSTVKSALDASHTRVDSNINISRLAGNQSEGAISINPTNPLNMVAISNLDRERVSLRRIQPMVEQPGHLKPSQRLPLAHWGPLVAIQALRLIVLATCF